MRDLLYYQLQKYEKYLKLQSRDSKNLLKRLIFLYEQLSSLHLHAKIKAASYCNDTAPIAF